MNRRVGFTECGSRSVTRAGEAVECLSIMMRRSERKSTSRKEHV
jgi:hypothetical protein